MYEYYVCLMLYPGDCVRVVSLALCGTSDRVQRAASLRRRVSTPTRAHPTDAIQITAPPHTNNIHSKSRNQGIVLVYNSRMYSYMICICI